MAQLALLGCELVDEMHLSHLIRPIRTGADVSGGAVLAGSIGSRPPRDDFVAVLAMHVLEVSPENVGTIPPLHQ